MRCVDEVNNDGGMFTIVDDAISITIIIPVCICEDLDVDVSALPALTNNRPIWKQLIHARAPAAP